MKNPTAETNQEIKRLQKKLDGIVNFLLGQVLKRMPSADPKAAREILVRKLDEPFSVPQPEVSITKDRT